MPPWWGILLLLILLDKSYTDDWIEFLKGFHVFVGDVVGDIKDSIGVIALGLTEHILNVDAGFAAGGGKGTDGVRNVLVEEANSLALWIPCHGDGRMLTEFTMLPFSRKSFICFAAMTAQLSSDSGVEAPR